MKKKITALKAQKRNKDRVSVFLDGEYAFGLARIVAAWLHVGDNLDEAKISELKSHDGHEKAYQQALHFLSYRERSEAEIRKNLEGHDYDVEQIDQAIARLQRSALVDDQRFARVWVENRSDFSPRGRRALRYELRKKNVDDQTIDKALEEIDEFKLALSAATSRLSRYAGMEWPEFRQKLGGFLSRRGFGYDVIAPVLERLWGELHEDSNSSGNEEEWE